MIRGDTLLGGEGRKSIIFFKMYKYVTSQLKYFDNVLKNIILEGTLNYFKFITFIMTQLCFDIIWQFFVIKSIFTMQCIFVNNNLFIISFLFLDYKSIMSTEKKDFVAKAIKSDRVVIFSKASCPFCKMAKEVIFLYTIVIDWCKILKFSFTH